MVVGGVCGQWTRVAIESSKKLFAKFRESDNLLCSKLSLSFFFCCCLLWLTYVTDLLKPVQLQIVWTIVGDGYILYSEHACVLWALNSIASLVSVLFRTTTTVTATATTTVTYNKQIHSHLAIIVCSSSCVLFSPFHTFHWTTTSQTDRKREPFFYTRYCYFFTFYVYVLGIFYSVRWIGFLGHTTDSKKER